MQRQVHPNIDAEENKTGLDLTSLVKARVVLSKLDLSPRAKMCL